MASILPDTCSCTAVEHSPDPLLGFQVSRLGASLQSYGYVEGIASLTASQSVPHWSLDSRSIICGHVALTPRFVFAALPSVPLDLVGSRQRSHQALLRRLMNAYAASPHFYTFAPASQSSPVAHSCAVLPVFALLTRAAAHVGLMYYLGAPHCSLGATSKSTAARPRVPRAQGLSPAPYFGLTTFTCCSPPCLANVLLRRLVCLHCFSASGKLRRTSSCHEFHIRRQQ